MSYSDGDDISMKAVLGIIGGIFAVIFLMWWFFAATWTSVPPDKIALHYTGGPIQGTHFVGVIQPGTGAKLYGLTENIYKLPSTQRNYIVSKDPKAGDEEKADFITAPSRDRVPFEFEAAIYFKLNPNPNVIRKFFEQICLHDHCTDLSKGGGWDRMLAQYLRPQLDFAVAQAAKQFDRQDLYSSDVTLDKMNAQVEANLKDDINAKLGGPYFCGPNSAPGRCDDFQVVIKNPTPPRSVTDAYANTAAAQQKVLVAKQNADASIAAAQGQADAQRARASAPALSQQQLDYIRAQAIAACASSSRCTLIVNGGGAGVNVNTGG